MGCKIDLTFDSGHTTSMFVESKEIVQEVLSELIERMAKSNTYYCRLQSKGGVIVNLSKLEHVCWNNNVNYCGNALVIDDYKIDGGVIDLRWQESIGNGSKKT